MQQKKRSRAGGKFPINTAMNRPELGLCCISLALKQSGISYRKMTAASFESLGRGGALEKLAQICLNNARVALETVKFCAKSGIAHYRLPSDIFPLLTLGRLGLSLDALPLSGEISEVLKSAGNAAKSLGVGLSMHPSQFVVFASADRKTRENSAGEINFNARILDIAGAPADFSSPINVHINSDPRRGTFVSDFEDGLGMLSPSARARLAIENEDRGPWKVSKLVRFLPKYGIPLTFDFLHHRLNNDGKPDEAAFFGAAETWGRFEPVFHYAESASSAALRSHADYCRDMPPYYGIPYVCQIEAKAKDFAIERILSENEQKNNL